MKRFSAIFSYITSVIVLLFMGCIFMINCRSSLSLTQRPYIQSGSSEGRITFEYFSTDPEVQQMVEMSLNEKLVQPVRVLYPTIPFFPVFYYPDHLVSIEKAYEAEGIVNSRKEYSFEIPDGEYFASLRINDNKLITYGYLSRSLNNEKGIEGDRFREYNGRVCRYYERSVSHLYCPKLKIISGATVKIQVIERRFSKGRIGIESSF